MIHLAGTEKPLIHGWLSMTEAPANGACFLQNASARKAMVKGMISGPPSCEARWARWARWGRGWRGNGRDSLRKDGELSKDGKVKMVT